MTDTTKELLNGFDADNETRDPQLDAAIKGAYENMGPSAEAQERMLAALQQAQADAQTEQGAEHSADADPAQAKGKGRVLPFLRKRVVPVAASVAVVLVVGAGVWTATVQSNMSPNLSVLSGSGTASMQEEATADSASGGAQYNLNSLGSAESASKSAAADESADAFIRPGDDYYAPVEQPERDNSFVNTSDQPLSTVSSDVDTASYCRLRAMINSDDYAASTLAYASNIRTEEALNYFEYAYPQATGSNLFGTSAQVGDCPWNTEHKLLVLGYNAAQKETSGTGSNLVFLIDVSGSMQSNDKLPLLKSSFSKLVEQLGANDRVSIVTYSGQERVVLTGARGNDYASIMKAVDSLQAEGSTNGEAGLKMAYNVAQDNFIDGGVNRIVMATDGDLNVGISSDEDLEKFISDKRKSGIYLSVLGFGISGYNDSALETLADNGNGQYHFIDCEAEARRVLVNNLTKNFEPLANDVKVQIEFNPAQVAQYRLVGYENRRLNSEDFLDDTKDAGDVGARGQFTVAYELVMADGASDTGGKTPPLKYQQGTSGAAANSSTEWATASLRYKPAGEQTSTQQQVVVSAANYTSSPTDDWRFASAVIEFAEALQEQTYSYEPQIPDEGVESETKPDEGTVHETKSSQIESASLDRVLNTLDSMQLNDERQEFKKLVEKVRG